MKVWINLRHGINYSTGIGNTQNEPIFVISGIMINSQQLMQTIDINKGIFINPIEICVKSNREKNNWEKHDEEIFKDISSINETWFIPWDNIVYITANATTSRERKINTINWRIRLIEENNDDEDNRKDIVITGKQQLLNYLNVQLKELKKIK